MPDPDAGEQRDRETAHPRDQRHHQRAQQQLVAERATGGGRPGDADAPHRRQRDRRDRGEHRRDRPHHRRRPERRGCPTRRALSGFAAAARTMRPGAGAGEEAPRAPTRAPGSRRARCSRGPGPAGRGSPSSVQSSSGVKKPPSITSGSSNATRSSTWAMPMVATSSTRRGASASRRMTAQSTSAPAAPRPRRSRARTRPSTARASRRSHPRAARP